MPTSLKALAELCEKLEKTRKRLEMVNYVSEFLKNLENDEVEPAVSLILGRPFPKWSPNVLNVSWATISSIIRRITGVDWNVFLTAFNKTGDIGSATKEVFENNITKRQTTLFQRTLTILEVRQTFVEIAEASGAGSREKKERLLKALFGSASPLEAKVLVKILVGEMRTGFHEGLMEQVVAKTFGVPLDVIQKKNMIAGDIGEVAAILKSGGVQGLEKINFKVFKPVNLMLAQMAGSVQEALAEHGGKSAFEYKYDGARVQIHKLGNKIRIFSRRLTDVTESLPEIVKLAEENVHAEEAILEGEVVAVDNRGFPIPFQHLMRRFRRTREIEDMAEKIPVKLYLFDVLYLDGHNLISLPYFERRKILAENTGRIPLTEQLVTSEAEKAEAFLKQAMDEGHEGLMAKSLESPYTPGFRGKRWLKIKPVLEPLDLVIVAAEYGYGRRHMWLSDYYLAAREPETGEFLILGKTFKGLTDAEIVEMTRRLKELVVKEEPRRVIVVPKVVVEVAYNEIQKSPKYKSGMALRFARITRIREDKRVEEADTIQRVREIYERQFLKKGKYKTDLQQKQSSEGKKCRKEKLHV